MKRSPGVTAAGSLALLGSAFLAFTGVSELLVALFALGHRTPQGSVPGPGVTMMIFPILTGALFNFGLTGWGVATGIGLLRLKPWSRISILIFAVFLAIGSLFAMMMPLFLRLPGGPGGGRDFASIFQVTMGLMFAMPLGVAIWWLILFTRKSAIAQFSGHPEALAAPVSQETYLPAPAASSSPALQRPIVLTVIAWFYLASAVSGLPTYLWFAIGPFRNVEFPFFGTLVPGKAMLVYLVLSSGLLLLSSIGLLKDRVWGFWLTFAVHVLSLFSVGATLLLPGRTERLARYMSSFQSNFSPGVARSSSFVTRPLLTVGFSGGMIFSIVVLALMWTSRRRFFEFVAVKAGTAFTA
jgi:hypothetical protein